MKSKLVVIAFILLASLGYAQTNEIIGKVIDAKTGTSLPGVNVRVKNGSQSVSTDFDGDFKLAKVADNAVLLFSYVGYKDTQLTVKGNQNVTIKMEEESSALKEVVVIGYGSQKKREVTGAVSVLDAKALDVIKPIKVEQALQGTVSGVNVTTQSGSPGAALDIR
ncbi:MAG: carboxypeptidase-like regulatory domain-containing protein, partial [Flavobacterium sp.]